MIQNITRKSWNHKNHLLRLCDSLKTKGGFTYQSHNPKADNCCLLILSRHFLCPLRVDMLKKQQIAPLYTSCTEVFKHSVSNKHHRYHLLKDTVTVDTPNSSCVTIISSKPLTIDRVPNIGHLQGLTRDTKFNPK